MGVTRLLILSEERLVGRGLASLLGSRFDTHSIESIEVAGRLLASERAEIVLWLGDCLDVGIVEDLQELKRLRPELGLCLLARAADAEALRPLLHDPDGVALLFRGGDLDVTHVLASLEEVLAGHAELEASALARLIEAGCEEQDALASLTDGEERILELVALGLRNREIARRVWKSERAVEKQVSHVFEKLGLGQQSVPHLDRRVTAARIFCACRPQTVEAREWGDTPLPSRVHALSA